MMKTLNLITTRWVLIIACTLIGTATLFTACEQQEVIDDLNTETPTAEMLAHLEPIITVHYDDSESDIDLRSYTLSEEKNISLNGWQKIAQGQAGKNMKVVIKPNKAINVYSVATAPGWRSQTTPVTANQTKTIEKLKSQLQGSESRWDFYTWASSSTWTNIKVYVKNSGGTTTPPSNTSLFPTGFTIGLEAGDAFSKTDGTNVMKDIVNDGKNRYQYLQESGAKFVRINFYKPANYFGSDLGWISKYDAVVNELRSRNIPIYAVVTDVVGGTNGGGETSYPSYGNAWQQKAWIDKYVTAFRAITDRYKGKITHYESFNEPNNWIASQKPAMDFDDYAYLLKKTWDSVKSGGNPNNITLISGPVMAHDDGVDVLCKWNWRNVYNNGACYLGKTIEKNGNTPYFDAVGYHIYVAQYKGDPASGVKASADALKNMLNAKGLWNKDVYVSEIGWDSNKISLTAQVNSIEQGLNKLRSLKNSHRIKGVCLFALSDFATPDLIEKYGLVSPNYMHGNNNGYEKSSWFKFKSMNKGN